MIAVEGKAKPLKKAVDKGTLKKRVTDLLRGGCSGDVFAESSFSLGGKRIVFDGTNVEDDETMRERSNLNIVCMLHVLSATLFRLY